MSKQSIATNRKVSSGSFLSIFMHADGADMFLMALGFLGAVGDGIAMPVMFYFTSNIMNSVGGFSSLSKDVFIDKIDKNAEYLCFLGIWKWMACFLEGYCWARTAERQASRLRSAYLKAVLRQEVAYFDLNVTSTSEIITSVSSDRLVIQEVISEKVPVFVMYMSLFCGAYVVAFILLWRLAIVALPFVVILVIPGLIYGRVLMSLSRKIREEYNKAGTVAEQAISSVRTVYSFVGENKSLTEYSDALEGSVKLGEQTQGFGNLDQSSHPNIVQYYGSELGEETLSVYLEYVSGGSIHRLLQQYGPIHVAAEGTTLVEQAEDVASNKKAENRDVVGLQEQRHSRGWFKTSLEMLEIFKSYSAKTSLLDDLSFYGNREKMLKAKRISKAAFQTINKRTRAEHGVPLVILKLRIK
ncbi:hypothetical protein L2E82_02323 [Cichorium intybus]|uniref:Uncharacterized protein n=1 Tax=Cichorium intybus TaxID=13427 RepID=A0ACB9H194_CICIN|nr:hypothetical protein L2E82_02323 [Cichorium intybus]